ncbi:C40 family peptidase [Pseudolysinimonas sp.]|uniref:C40 family peptidase n=1 Tax=Pseudolysinimonas sp. TaxID=2680009 RepID=UPI003F7E9EA6
MMRVVVPATAVWAAPDAPHDLDAAAVADRPDPDGWAAALDDAARLDLHGRVVTQTLLGEPAIVVEESDGWSRVRLPWQPTHRALDGYPGWVPTPHLAPGSGPADPRAGAVVTARTAHAVADDGERLVLSLGTVLDEAGPGALRHPDGRLLRLDAAAVAAGSARAALRPTELARALLGLGYLWGGLSGWGIDCSGLVHLTRRAVGVVVPRDASDQALTGLPVAARDVREGDAVLFDDGRTVHHTGLALTADRMIHAPRTGFPVAEADVAEYPDDVVRYRRVASG